MRYSNNPFEGILIFFREHKAIGKIMSLVVLLLVLAICWNIGVAHESLDVSNQYIIPLSEADTKEKFPYLAVTELDIVTEADNPTIINLSDYSGDVDITSGGEYILSGSLTGTVHIASKEQNIHIYLNNVNIISKAGPAIYCEEADKLVVTIMDGTVNTISDSGNYRDYDDLEACFYSDCDIAFNGNGLLSVNGYYKDAIQSKDIVKILGGTYTIKCKRTGIRGNDGIVVNAGNITISSEKYGLKTTKRGTDGRGNLLVCGGELYVVAGRYAFVTTKADLYIYDCMIYVRSVVDTYDCGGAKRIQEGCVQ